MYGHAHELCFHPPAQLPTWLSLLLPCRVASTAKAAGGGSKAKGKGAAAAAAEEPPSMDDLLPRADISGQINGDLIALFSSANWKERKDAMEQVEGIIAAAGGRIQPCVSSIPWPIQQQQQGRYAAAWAKHQGAGTMKTVAAVNRF